MYTRNPRKFIIDHYKEMSVEEITNLVPASREYVEIIIEVEEKGLDEGEYIVRTREKKPEPFIAKNDVNWDNPSYEKFLKVNYSNFDFKELRKKFFLATDYWVPIAEIKRHTPQSDKYGVERTSGEFEEHEVDKGE